MTKSKKSNQIPGIGMQNNRCREDETFISRLRTGHILLTHGYMMEGLSVPECELCHNRAMTVIISQLVVST